MKKLIAMIALAVLPLLCPAQSLFDKYEDMDDVTTVVASKSMFSLLASIDAETDDKEAQEVLEMSKKLTGLRVFTTDKENIGSQMLKDVNSYLKNNVLEELMRVKDKESNVKIYVKKGKEQDHVTELLMIVSGLKDMEVEGRNFETVLITITGDIDLKKIGSLTKKMNLPSELNEVNKSK